MMRTVLFEEHQKLGAKFVDFHGWEMPIHYEAGILEEHDTVRNSVGIFDVSHMGQIVVDGKEACSQLQGIYTNDILGMAIGKAIYTHILNEEGKIIDDTIVYRLAEYTYMAIPNASRIETVHDWMTKHILTGVTNLSDQLACFAVQGPKATETMIETFQKIVNTIERFSYMIYNLDSQSNYIYNRLESPKKNTGHDEINDIFTSKDHVFIARTGYTGENGFELIMHNDIAPEIWKMIMKAGNQYGIKPIGLGARDTLRLEMGYLLSGQDFNGNQTSLESASSWVIKWDHDFIGKEALTAQKESKSYERLVGIRLEKKLAARQGSLVFPTPTTEFISPVETKGSPLSVSDRKGSPPIVSTEPIGTVTSGGYAPSVGTAIALARVKKEFTKAGTELELEVRGRRLKGIVTKTPFIKK